MKNLKNIKITQNNIFNETVFSTVLGNGLRVFICKKEGFIKKIGMFGTIYGSVDNDFIDITTGKRVKVPDGVAHFLEHKLFEKEGANALDLFSKKGISSNAYTSFDHTVYFFETIDKFEESVKMLVNLVKEPYFTDENVEKEKGIITQEINMYNDDASYSVYFNMLRNMYIDHPVRIDIGGSEESISGITKETLYTCYNTFYSPQNMFYLVVGDVDVQKTIDLIDEEVKKYDRSELKEKEIIKFETEEKEEILNDRIESKMDIFLPQVCMGYKLPIQSGEEIIKNEVISEFINDMYFSKISKLYKELYENKLIFDELSFDYEGSKTFSHVVISGESLRPEELAKRIEEEVECIKNGEIDKNMFEIIKRKKIGNGILKSDNLQVSYRNIIDSILSQTELYLKSDFLNKIEAINLKDFVRKLKIKPVISIINSN